MKKQETPKRQSGARGSIPTPTNKGQMVSAMIPKQLAALIERLTDENGYDEAKSFLCDAFTMWARAVEQYDIITAEEQAPLQALSEYADVIDMLSEVEL